jgi:dihydrofolate reductase
MRKITFGGATSLDNYLARKDDAVDWLLWCDEAASAMAAYWRTIDTVLMGRKTYEVGVRLGHGKISNPGTTTYVFSQRLKPDCDPQVTITSADAPGFVRQLKHQDGKDICLMGGGELARSLFEADLIDEVRFNVHPVLLGSGIPAFHPMNRQIDLEMVTSLTFKNGCVFTTYRVRR